MSEYTHGRPDSPLRFVQRFRIGDRHLTLYWHENRPSSAPYSLYWDDERNPIQHNMTDQEVFSVLADLLEKLP